MRLPARLAPAVVALLLAGACGATASPSASPTPGASGPPVPAAPWLRLTTTQAIPPVNAFVLGPVAVVTADGGYITQAPVPAIFPGPLLPAYQVQAITDAGRAAILAEAARLGLLGQVTDFTGGGIPGAMTGRMELTVDGRRHTLTGDPSAVMQCVAEPCQPPPETPAAFASLWQALAFPGPLLAGQLGEPRPFTAAAYAILVGPPPTPDPALGAHVSDWPLDVPLATFGGPVAGGYRCGLVDGVAAATLTPVLRAATALTQWTQDPTTSLTVGLTVRPILADEDPCAETFGAG